MRKMNFLKIKVVVRNLIGSLFCKDENLVKKEIDKFEIISFDIFDTLVKRKVSFPQDVFPIVEQRYNEYAEVGMFGYKEQRIIAEQHARKKCDQEEITLDEIYEMISLSEEKKSELKKIEKQIEEEVCYPNGSLFNLYKYALEKNKQIIITSDMYLPEKTITRILAKCGYIGYKKIYLSSTYKKTKHSGSIFDEIKKEYRSKSILHIGDNVKSDYAIPKKKGIHAVLISAKAI